MIACPAISFLSKEENHTDVKTMNEFVSIRIARQYVHEVEAPPEKIFTLLCPVKEYDWIEGWDGRLIYSESGTAENLCLFAKALPEAGEGIWVVSRHDPSNHRIEFVNTFPQSHVEKLEIQLEKLDQNRTRVTWTRIGTSLTEKGSQVVRKFYGEHFDERMKRIGGALEHYCRTGEMKKAGRTANSCMPGKNREQG